MGQKRVLLSYQLFAYVFAQLCFFIPTEALSSEAVQEFKHFKVKDLNRYQSQMQRAAANQRNMANNMSTLGIGDVIANPMLQTVWTELVQRYKKVGQDQVDQVRRNNGFYWQNEPNNIGFGYHQNFLDFSVTFSRQLSPDLFDDKRWIVKDELNVFIDASQFLGQLRDQDAIEITDETLAAYAGIVFKRTYRYVHFAGSYEQGLSDHYEKLFLGFMLFEGGKFLDLKEYESLQREDFLSASFAAVASGPITGNLSGAIAIHGKYERLAKVDILALGKEDERSDSNERLRMSYEKTKTKAVGLSVSLQLDFLNILKKTLMSFDFTYELQESYKLYLSFKASDLNLFTYDNPVKEQVGKILKAEQPDLNIVAPYLVSEEIRSSEIMRMKYAVLLMGGMREQATEMLQITQGGTKKTFFRHNYEKINFQQDFWTWLLQGIIKSFLKMDSFVNQVASTMRRLNIEYESLKNLMTGSGYLFNQDGEKVSFRFTSESFAQNTVGGSKKKYKQAIVDNLKGFTPVHIDTVQRVQNDVLVGPMRITTNFQMNKEALDYFHQLSLDQATSFILELCEFGNASFSTCKNQLVDAYDYYMKTLFNQNYPKEVYDNCRGYHGPIDDRKRYPLSDACMGILKTSYLDADMLFPIDRFKDFLELVIKMSNQRQDLYNFFGTANVFMYGQFEARTADGAPYVSHFKDGEFEGLGVIDNYKRAIYGDAPGVNNRIQSGNKPNVDPNVGRVPASPVSFQ